MRRRCWVTAVAAGLLLLAPMSARAQGGQLKTWSRGGSGEFRVETYTQRISSGDSVDYPRWDPGEAPCPLAPRRAVALATEAASAAFPEVKGWRPSTVSIISMTMDATGSERGIWFYEVGLWPEDRPQEREDTGDHLSIMVGLTGSVPSIRKGEFTPPVRGPSQPGVRLRRVPGAVTIPGVRPLEEPAHVTRPRNPREAAPEGVGEDGSPKAEADMPLLKR